MGINTQPAFINFYSNGSQFTINLDGANSITNNGPGIATGVQVQVTMSPGIALAPGQSAVNQGVFDDLTGLWLVGSLLGAPPQSETGSFVFDVIDDSLGPYTITFTVTSDACDCNLENNVICFETFGISCNDVLTCVLPAGANIYTVDNALTANRVVTGAGFDLSFTGVQDFIVQGTGSIDGMAVDTVHFEAGNLVRLDSLSSLYYLGDGVGGNLPPVDNTNTQILSIDPATGQIEITDGSAIASVINTIYSSDDTIVGNRTIDGGGNDLIINNLNSILLESQSATEFIRFVDSGDINIGSNVDININSGVDIILTSLNDVSINTVGILSLDSTSGIYQLITTPPTAGTPSLGMIYNTGSFQIEVVTISHGNFVDDPTAQLGGVPQGGHYFNTTNGVMHTQMLP